MNLHKIAPLILAVGIMGCASKPAVPQDPVEVSLSKSFARIATSMEELALIESASRAGEFSARNHTYDESKIPPLWLQEITLVEDFHGDVEQFVAMLSTVAGIGQPRVVTPNTGRPVTIAIAKGKRKLISFIADAGNQTGTKATLVPSIPLNRVVITYGK